MTEDDRQKELAIAIKLIGYALSILEELDASANHTEAFFEACTDLEEVMLSLRQEAGQIAECDEYEH